MTCTGTSIKICAKKRQKPTGAGITGFMAFLICRDRQIHPCREKEDHMKDNKKIMAAVVIFLVAAMLTACSCAGVSESTSEKESRATETTVEETTAETTEETTEAETGKAVKKDDKKDTKKETETTAAKKEETAKASAEAVTPKPAQENQSGSNQSGQSSQGSSQKAEEKKQDEPKQPKETEHVHSWQTVYKTVHHDAVYEDVWVVDQEAWTEDAVWEGHSVCWCGLDFVAAGFTNDDVANHQYAHMDAGENTQYGTKYVCVQEEIYHEEVGHWEKREVTPAWDEKVPDGEKCSSCGATR